jgi:hypothetical protein
MFKGSQREETFRKIFLYIYFYFYIFIYFIYIYIYILYFIYLFIYILFLYILYIYIFIYFYIYLLELLYESILSLGKNVSYSCYFSVRNQVTAKTDRTLPANFRGKGVHRRFTAHIHSRGVQRVSCLTLGCSLSREFSKNVTELFSTGTPVRLERMTAALRYAMK